MKIFGFIITPFIVLTLAVFLSFYYRASWDNANVILGTIIYLPYVILLTVINFGLILTGQKYLSRTKFKYLTLLLTTIILTIILLAGAGHFKIYYWTVSFTEFVILNFILILLNFTGLFIQPKLT